jgi:hypothetical protein
MIERSIGTGDTISAISKKKLPVIVSSLHTYQYLVQTNL